MTPENPTDLADRLHHRKLDLPDPGLGHALFADVYLPRHEPRAPLLLYVGGAISPETYELRRSSRPDEPAELVLGSVRSEELGAVMLSCPYGSGDRLKLLEGFRRSVLEDLLPAIGREPDEVRAIVGNSMGAFLGFGLAATLPSLRTLGCLAGVGMVEALERTGRPEPFPRLLCATNHDDPARQHSERLASWAEENRLPMVVLSGPGGHGFEDYRSNGNLESLLRLVL